MKKASPFAPGFAQTDVADCYPVPDSARTYNPKGNSLGKIPRNFESAIRRAVIDNHQLDPVNVLLAHTLKHFGEEFFAVVYRHNH
jgi:hypothetical protein